MTIDFEDLQTKAFEEFKKVALAEEANGAETLALFRLVPQFSTAPEDETADTMCLMHYWSRNGHGEWLVEAAEELRDWAAENGYKPATMQPR